MKKRIAIIIILCVSITLAAVLLLQKKEAEYVEAVSEESVWDAYTLLTEAIAGSETMYTDFLKQNTLPDGTGSGLAMPETGEAYSDYDGLATVLDYNDTTTYRLTVETEGLYYLKLDYAPASDTMSDFGIDITINGEQPYYEMKTIALPLFWSDETKDFPRDGYGDETAPKQIRQNDWVTINLYNSTYSSSLPLLFHLKQGSNAITVKNVAADGLLLGSLSATEPESKIPSYEEYAGLYTGDLVQEQIEINATEYIKKNTTQAIYTFENSPAVSPYDAQFKQINTMNWTDAGTEVTYEVTVKTTGLYHLAFHYKNEKEEFDAFETIRIDGEIPFKEMINYAFPSTGSTWTNLTLSDTDGSEYEFYLTAGTHTITLRAEQEPVEEAFRYARLLSEHVSMFALQITKVTGSETDENRTWKMTKYLPQIPEYLDAYTVLIQHIRALLQENSTGGINGALLTDMGIALDYIEKMAEYPDEIALYTSELTGSDNSVLAALSHFTTQIREQDFTLDRIYVTGEDTLPKATAGVFGSAKNWFARLFYSFTSDKYSVETEDEEVVTVWVNRALTHVDLLQKMADTDFYAETGIRVKISAMPDANKLTMAAAAGQTPDIALGLSSYMPFDLASRDALYDMTQFEDFWSVADRFTAGAFVPYVFNEGVYAVPETLDFRALVYRTDIFESLGLTPPDTWQEVVDMLPVLQRYGMNFYHNISSGVGYKWFYQTSPLIYQNNGRLYDDDGLQTAIGEPNSVKGLQELGDLFIAYSLDTQVISFFNSFRYSILPVGLIDLNEYILLKNGAPELSGQWALSAYPGTVQEDGSISRWYIANGTGGVIFQDTKKAEDAWIFLKWWTDHDTQVNYTYTLQSTYGDQFFWLSSNVEAVEDSPIEQKDKEVILEQIQWLRDVPRSPGQYLLERSLSDIWNAMVLDGTSAQVAIDEKTIDINREINRKMTDLGFYDEDGSLLKSYVIHDLDWIQDKIDQAAKEAE